MLLLLYDYLTIVLTILLYDYYVLLLRRFTAFSYIIFSECSDHLLEAHALGVVLVHLLRSWQREEASFFVRHFSALFRPF